MLTSAANTEDASSSKPPARLRASPFMAGEGSSSSVPHPSPNLNPVTASPDRGLGGRGEEISPAQARHRRSILRRSGGFLLEPTRASDRDEGSKRRTDRNVSWEGNKSRTKGKRVLPYPDRQPLGAPKPSPEKSKLSPGQDQDTDYIQASSNLDGSIPPPETSLATTSSRVADLQAGNTLQKTLDNDSAEIVNLALNLSENRRRWFHVAGPSETTPKTNNLFSTSPQATPSPILGLSPLPKVPNNRDHSQIFRRGRDLTPRIGFAANLSSHPNGNLDAAEDESFHASTEPPFSQPSLVQSAVIPSEATMQRVQKAKAALELAYEYRRLLQYLPEIPLPNSNLRRPATAKTSHSTVDSLKTTGRCYNPLQYVRNRRVRFREGCPLNPEAEGWSDVDAVRKWVDSVASQHITTGSKEEDVNLPLFPSPDRDYAANMEAKDFGSGAKPQTTKPARPRSDWESNPWSLLADAYWTSKTANRAILEDRNGNKIYQPHTEESIRRQRIISPDVDSRGSANTFEKPRRSLDQRGKGVGSEEVGKRIRGRAADRTRDDLSREGTYSSSSDRHSKWPRKILRSPSVSSSDESTRPALIGPRSRRVPYDALQERALLERQLREFENKEMPRADDRRAAVSKESLKLRGTRHRHDHSSQEHREQATFEDAVEQQQSPQNEVQDFKHFNSHTFEEFDSTAPNSPQHSYTVPNITINLTPPRLDKSSPQKRRQFPQRSIFAEVEKGMQKVHNSELTGSRQTAQPEGRSADSHRGSLQLVRDLTQAAPSNKGSRSGHTRQTRSLDEPPNARSNSKESDSRLRGLLRGSRIAELVANPVTKVSDLIWRHEEASAGNESSSAYDSFADPIRSNETDDAQRVSRSNSESSIQSFETGKGFHLSNLPVFRSPFAPNRAERSITGHENISHLELNTSKPNQDAENRSRKLAPAISLVRSTSTSPSLSNEKVDALEDARRSSAMSRRFAVVDPFDDDNENEFDPVKFDLLDSPHSKSHRRWASLDTAQYLMEPDLYRPGMKITLDRIARLKIVQFSCAVRANELSVRASQPMTVLTEEAQHLRELTGAEAPSGVAQMENKLYMSTLLADAVDQSFSGIRAAAHTFSTETITNLHERLHGLHGQIADDLTQMARSAERGADDLSTQLATDCTIDIKRLNETIEVIMRRRRRRMRTLRRAGFAVLEWMVLGAMWVVWLVVVLVLLIRGTVRMLGRVLKWLLWL